MSFIAAALALAVTSQNPSANTLPFVPGTTPAPDCGGMRDIISRGNQAMQCITFPMEEAATQFNAQLQQVRSAGWIPAGGQANIILFQKANAAASCDRLTVAGFWDFRKHPQPAPGIPAYIGLMVEPDQPCQTSNGSVAP